MSEFHGTYSDMIQPSTHELTDLQYRLAGALILNGECTDNMDAVSLDGMSPRPKRFSYDIQRGSEHASALMQKIKELLFTPDECQAITLKGISVGYATPRILDVDDPVVYGDSVDIGVDAVMEDVGVDIYKYIIIHPIPRSQDIEGTIDTTYSRGDLRLGLGRTDFSGENVSDPEVLREIIDSVTENERPLGLAELEAVEHIIAYIQKNKSPAA